jgi:hypothetical protein
MVNRKKPARNPAPPERAEELLDWDAWLEEPPARPERAVLARFEYGGRDTPMPMDLLEDE